MVQHPDAAAILVSVDASLRVLFMDVGAGPPAWRLCLGFGLGKGQNTG